MNCLHELEEAYTYAYPLVLMSYTAKTIPENQLVHSRALANPDDKSVVTLNVDTLYTQIMVNLQDEPMVLTLPGCDRFMQAQVLNAWSNTVAVLDAKGDYAFVRKGADVLLPEGMTKVELPTQLSWVIVRTVLNGEEDLPNVLELQDAMDYRPLSFYISGDTYKEALDEQSISSDVVPVEAVAALSPQKFFGTANQLMANNPPAPADAEIIKKVAALGIGPSLTFDASVFDDDRELHGWKTMLKSFYANIDKGSMLFARRMGIWNYFGKPIGDFGTEYVYRAAVAVFGFGANTVEVAIYPRCTADESGEELVGTEDYILHFDSLPPVLDGGFWSVTAYNNENFLIANSMNRYAVNDRSAYTVNGDGSVDILLTSKHFDDQAMFVLPTDEGGFHLYLRIYKPNMEKIESWIAPTVTRCDK